MGVGSDSAVAANESVGYVSEAGPRPTNQDRGFAHLDPDDGAWVIAVADGMGGTRRADEAADAALAGFPSRIDSIDAMRSAFRDAYERVHDLCPEWMTGKFSIAHERPGTTLCVSSWTAATGLIVAWMGDTIPVAIATHETEITPRGRALGAPHRNHYGAITKCLGGIGYPSTLNWESLLTVMQLPTPETMERVAVILMSDGVWESLLPTEQPPEQADYMELVAERVARAVTDFRNADASAIAQTILTAATTMGLHDNATVAVGVRDAQQGAQTNPHNLIDSTAMSNDIPYADHPLLPSVMELVKEVMQPEAAERWMHRQNPGLGGETPLALVLSGHGERVEGLLLALAEGVTT